MQDAINYDDPQTLEVLGETLYDSGSIDQSELIFRHLIDLDPNNSSAKIMLADILNENGDTDSALLLLDEISEQDEKYLAVMMQKADIYQTMGMDEVSESLLSQALTIDPTNQALIFGMAELLYSEGKYEKAIFYYNKLLNNGVTTYLSQNIKVRYANCLNFTGKFEQAAKIYETFNNILLSDDDLFIKGTVFYEIHEFKKSIDTLEELRERTPDYASIYLVLASSYEETGNLDQAYQIALKGYEINEFDFKLLLKFSQLAQKLGHFEQAVSGYQKILKNDPENIQALINLSLIYLSKSSNQEAIELLSGQESLDPRLSWNLGQAYLRQDQLTKAQENLLAVFDQFQDEPDYLLDLITLFKKQRNIKPILAMMQMYLKLVPTDDKIATEYENLRNEQELND
ncbi:tetratricopeptide repeat protein [Xylocopilactobacillus apis]|uniref:tetratricopeptide repeat protein n=1 Tax=Xylocopilactobacillus apis TaxID=2932183 RepID=UPI002952B13D|nr:tetratricopeptide repeat protein [Xylocopilactobacillus apis]